MPRNPELYRTKAGYYRATIDGCKRSFGRDYEQAASRFAAALATSSHARAHHNGDPVYLAVAADTWKSAEPTWPRRKLTKLLLRFLAESALADCRLSALPPDLIGAFAKWMSAQYKPSTQHTYLGLLFSLLKWCVENGWMPAVPPRPKLPPIGHVFRDVPQEQLQQIFARLSSRVSAPAGRILRFILFTGCRPGEARRLCWRHVDLAAGVCTLDALEHKTGKKTGLARTIYLTQPASDLLRSIGPGEPDARVFLSYAKRPYSPKNLVAICERVGFCAYQLRHTFAQNALDQQPLEVVSALLGHRQLATTQIYAQVRAPRAKASAASLTLPTV